VTVLEKNFRPGQKILCLRDEDLVAKAKETNPFGFESNGQVVFVFYDNAGVSGEEEAPPPPSVEYSLRFRANRTH